MAKKKTPMHVQVQIVQCGQANAKWGTALCGRKIFPGMFQRMTVLGVLLQWSVVLLVAAAPHKAAMQI